MKTSEEFRKQQRILLDMFTDVVTRYNRLCKVFDHFYRTRSVALGNAQFWMEQAREEYRQKENLTKLANDAKAVIESYNNRSSKTKAAPAPAQWISVREKLPSNGVLVVVKTKDGAKYFGSAFEGKLMSNVEYWYPLPE